MPAFVKYGITQIGENLIAKGIAGKKLQFTEIVLGDGELTQAQDPKTMEKLVNQVISLPITSIEVLGDKGEVKVTGFFSNEDLKKGFYYREIGLQCKDPDSGLNLLYCYGNATDKGEWIPPSGTNSVIEKSVNIQTTVGSATNVTAIIDSMGKVTVKQLEMAINKHNIDPEAHKELFESVTTTIDDLIDEHNKSQFSHIYLQEEIKKRLPVHEETEEGVDFNELPLGVIRVISRGNQNMPTTEYDDYFNGTVYTYRFTYYVHQSAYNHNTGIMYNRTYGTGKWSEWSATGTADPVEWVELKGLNGFVKYNDNPNNVPHFAFDGKTLFLRGSFKYGISGDIDKSYPIAKIPEYAVPRYNRFYVALADTTRFNVVTLGIYPNGEIKIINMTDMEATKKDITIDYQLAI